MEFWGNVDEQFVFCDPTLQIIIKKALPLFSCLYPCFALSNVKLFRFRAREKERERERERERKREREKERKRTRIKQNKDP